jgi:hypothetical protein
MEPAGMNCFAFPQIVDAQNWLVGSNGCGLLHTTDAGASWNQLSPGRFMGGPFVSAARVLYWYSDHGLTVSNDKGQTWTQLGAGPVGNLFELPDGRLLALGSTHIVMSADGGKSWKEIGAAMPFKGENCGIYGFGYSTVTKKLFLNHNDCKGTVLPSSLFMADFDYTKS